MRTTAHAAPVRRLLLLVGLCAALLGLLAPAASAAADPAPAGRAAQGSVVATFHVQATTQWGQNVYVVGDIPALGSWNPDKAVPLSSANYPEWSGTVVLPASTPIRYKYLIKTPGEPVTWEQGPNRTATTPPTGSCVTHDTFRY